jgi:hypothetical protein
MALAAAQHWPPSPSPHHHLAFQHQATFGLQTINYTGSGKSTCNKGNVTAVKCVPPMIPSYFRAAIPFRANFWCVTAGQKCVYFAPASLK